MRASSAWADYDNDGFLDLFMATVGGEKNLLFHNNGNTNAWLIVRLIGTLSNRDAIGAWVKLRLGHRTRWHQVMATHGYLSQSELPVTFGLGALQRVEGLTITWPDGSTQEVANLTVDRLLTITQPR